MNEINSKFRLKRDFILFNLIGIREKYGFLYDKYIYKNFNETYYLCKRVNKDIKKKEILFPNFINIDKSNYKNKTYITISLGGRNILKKWKIEHWEILIKKIIICCPHLNIKIIGSKEERNSSEYISRINKNKILNLAGKTNIKNLFNIINNSKYHLSHDDGTMHIASIFKKKGAAIFGITSAKGRWFPSNSNQKIFYPKKKINEIDPNKVFKKIYYDLKNLR